MKTTQVQVPNTLLLRPASNLADLKKRSQFLLPLKFFELRELNSGHAAQMSDLSRAAFLHQASATKFRVDYLKPSGAIGFYHPDWVVVQKDDNTEVNWIIETKGRVW